MTMELKIAGASVLVDDDSRALLAPYTYTLKTKGVRVKRIYAVVSNAKWNGTMRGKYMHQLIAGRAPRGTVVDHKNGDTLDNRKSNLRFVSRSTNCRNRHHPPFSGAPVFGIYFHSRAGRRKRWQAKIAGPNHTDRSLGYFETREEAVLAREVAEERIYRGEKLC